MISLEEIIADKRLRIAYWEMNFPFWFQYHYWFKAKKFHKDWMVSMQSSQNVFLEAFRASRKTTIARGYVCRCIAYKKHPSIIIQSYEDSLSGAWVHEVAKMLFLPSIIEDHWYLFPIERKQEDLAKRSLQDFESTTWVKIAAKSLGQTIRGTNTFDLAAGISARPTLLVCQPKWNIVLTDKWEKDVSRIWIWDIVYSHDGTYNPVLYNWKTEPKKIISIKIHWYNEDYSFCVGHQIWAKNYKWSFQRRYERLYTPEFINIEDVKIWAYVWFPIDMTEEVYKRNIKYPKFKEIIRWEKWQIKWWKTMEESIKQFTIPDKWYYILWMFCWDWSLAKNGIVIYCDRNKQDIIKRIEEHFDWSICKRIKWNVEQLILSSVDLQRICKQIKQPKNSWKVMPKGFEREKIENQIEFIKGYIDSDWFLERKTNAIRITSVCLPLLRQTQRILLRLGITSYIRNWIDWSDDYDILWNKCKTQKKYDLYMRNWIEILWYGMKSQERYKYDNLPVHIKDGYLWSSVREIKEQWDDTCYAFVVDNTKSYCWHLIAHHNCDDIDVNKSIANVEIINANEKKIIWETIAALDPLNRKIIFLGNTINEDGIVPRFRERYKTAKNRDIFHQPLFDEKWVNLWPEVFTDEVVADLKADWPTSWNQNYLLIPSQSGSWVFIRSYFDYFLLSHFEDIDSPLKKTDLKCAIFVDPAFSSSDTSDDAVVIGAWEHKMTKKYYLIDWYADTSAPSKTIKAIIVMYNNMEANGFKPEFISVENVTINKSQTQFIKDLKDALVEAQINCPIYLYEPRTNKMARIKDNLEAVMSQQWIKTNRNIVDKSFIVKVETQFLEYPNWDHDDVIDCISQMVEVFRKKQVKEQPKQQERTYIDPKTGQRRNVGEHNVFTLNNIPPWKKH